MEREVAEGDDMLAELLASEESRSGELFVSAR
jgi:hypothetical protein